MVTFVAVTIKLFWLVINTSVLHANVLDASTLVKYLESLGCSLPEWSPFE
jgi:hypothetical protein